MISQNEALQFLFLGIMFGVFVIFAIREGKNLYQQAKLEYEYMKHPRLVPYVQELACNGPHTWRDVSLALRGLPLGKYKVCLECGSIMGKSEFMVSREVLQQMIEALKIAEDKVKAEQELYERVGRVADGYIDQYIRRNFSQEVNDAHFAEKLIALGKYSRIALADAADKVTAEMDAQTDLDDRYDGWPSKIKGNA